MPPKFHNKDGSLTRCALFCGYYEFDEINGIQTTMKEEHTVYHVKQYDFNEHKPLYWEVFYTLKDARKAYNKLKRGIK